MHLGLGLYRHMLTRENYQFARQAGATHIVAHLVDYFRGGAENPDTDQPTGTDAGWGLAGDPDKLWTLEELKSLRLEIEAEGLKLAAIENLDPAHWHDVLLDGPQKRAQLEDVKTIIRRMGEAEIPILGYNFSIAGVAGRVTGPFARGGAQAVGMDGPLDAPMPQGMVWNMVYDPEAPPGFVTAATSRQLWSRVEEFLSEVLPVAETAGVTLAAHPDDPPLTTVRGQPRLVYEPDLFGRLLDLVKSPANKLEFCIGTIAEMQEGDVYEATDRYSCQGKIAYVHFRNVRGKAPYYQEQFVDDGDVDMPRVLTILRRNGFDGVVIPDHAPQMTCDAPWHAGMAYTLGYLQGWIQHA
jgi:mannonate dehydratase